MECGEASVCHLQDKVDKKEEVWLPHGLFLHPTAEGRRLQGPRGVQSHKTEGAWVPEWAQVEGCFTGSTCIRHEVRKGDCIKPLRMQVHCYNSYPSLNHHIQRPNYDQALRSLELDQRYPWEPREQEFLDFFSSALWLIWLMYNLIFGFFLTSLTSIWLPSTFLYFCQWRSSSLLIVLVSLWPQLAPGPS